MEGYLQIWHGFFSRWSKQYFRIHEETLLFGPTKDEITGKIHLKVAQIVTTVDDPISFVIHTGTDTLRIRANSIEQRVRWFKRIRSIQRESEQANYIKQMSAVDRELGKDNKVKALEQLTVELWQSHADLENIIEEISLRVKGPNSIKSLTDKLRIIVQTIKLKNSEALKIIEDQVTSMSKHRDDNAGKNYFNVSEKSEFENSALSIRENDTRYMSFEEVSQGNKNRIFRKKSSINKNGKFKTDNFQDSFESGGAGLQRNSHNTTNYFSFDNPNEYMGRKQMIREQDSDVERYSLNSPKKMRKKISNGIIENPLKIDLLENNEVFKKIKKSMSNVPYRSSLPSKFTPEEKFSFISILTGAGSDLTKFSFPVTTNEPLSFLQKGCEQMYYSKLLDEADFQADPEMRILYVAAFVVSQYSLNDHRTKKPFNPLLGETFQFVDEERDFEYLSEQVSHHPPITAIHCRSNHFQLLDNSKNTTSFQGTSLKFIPSSKGRIFLQKFKDEYIFNKCTMSLSNLMMGKLYIENSGEVTINCKKFNTKVLLRFKEQSFWNKNEPNSVEGEVFKEDTLMYTLKGKWDLNLAAYSQDNKRVISLWERRHVENPEYYNFNDYTLLLNHLNKNNFEIIPPTDSRLRPDQRALEFQDLDLAASEKHRLEEKQRRARKDNEEMNRSHDVLWFSKEKNEEGQELYLSNEVYWEERRRGIWRDCPDIF